MACAQTILVGILLAGFAFAEQDAAHSDEPLVNEELAEVLDRLDTDLASNAATEPSNKILAVGPTAVPLLCDRLMRPAMFASTRTSPASPTVRTEIMR